MVSKKIGLIAAAAAVAPLARADTSFTGAVATLRGATSAITGSVTIEGLSPLLVSIEARVSGVADGVYGFHIHQYGDLRSPLDLETVGRHFIPLCGAGKSRGGGRNHVEFTGVGGGDDDRRRRLEDHPWMPPGTRLEVRRFQPGGPQPRSQPPSDFAGLPLGESAPPLAHGAMLPPAWPTADEGERPRMGYAVNYT